MKRIRMLRVSFDAELKSVEVPAFRSAIIDKVGEENILFHHHINSDKYLYKYPLIQYKAIRNQPTIICIEHGVDEIHKYFEKRNWNILVNDRFLDMKVSKLELNQFTLQVWNRTFEYNIHNWIALNQENTERYNKLTAFTERLLFLEKTITGNIISFAKGVGWDVDKKIEVKILDFKEPRTVKLKSNDLVGFNMTFSSNVFLPNYIGLGKAVSKGYGIVKINTKTTDK